MLLPIVQTGDPVLRKVARALTLNEIRSEPIQELIENMKETMRAAPGVGLAAPQIGESIQLVVIEDDADEKSNLSPEELERRERTPVPFHVLINPKFNAVGHERVTFFEGCLSVDGFVAKTRRYRSVAVTALNERGEEVKINASGWYARIIQHEVDHLNGALYIDKMDTTTFTTVGNKVKFGD
jgi:peptide deformylase